MIDVRNNYETRIGKFKGAVDPCTTAFREFPSWIEDQFQLSEGDTENSEVDPNSSNERTINQTETPNDKMPQRVAMYCTGGIRCEKASSYLLSKGFKEVILDIFFMPHAFIFFCHHTIIFLQGVLIWCLVCVCVCEVGRKF